MTNGYDFYFKTDDTVLTFPITPEELKITSDSNNETITLINEGEVNLLKSPSLTEVEFEARFPMRNYPYSRDPEDFQTYFDVFKELKEEKNPFRFIVARATPDGKRTWDTNLQMALEKFELTESVDNGDDVLISFTLKQYKEYGVKIVKVISETKSDKDKDKKTTTKTTKTTTSTSKKSRKAKKKSKKAKYYTVKKGDCLWNIAKKFYGNASKWKSIYKANKSKIESTAKKHGKRSSSNGHWIYAGTKLKIP